MDKLIEIFNSQLGVDFDEKIILVGAGNLGRALMNYNKWDYVVGEIACAFDVDPAKCGTQFGVEVYPMSELDTKIPEGCRIAILTISHDVQETVVNYNEDVNKLGVVVQGQLYLNGESKPTIIENLTTNGMPVISIPSSDGTSLYAFCKQVSLNSNLPVSYTHLTLPTICSV